MAVLEIKALSQAIYPAASFSPNASSAPKNTPPTTPYILQQTLFYLHHALHTTLPTPPLTPSLHTPPSLPHATRLTPLVSLPQRFVPYTDFAPRLPGPPHLRNLDSFALRRPGNPQNLLRVFSPEDSQQRTHSLPRSTQIHHDPAVSNTRPNFPATSAEVRSEISPLSKSVDAGDELQSGDKSRGKRGGGKKKGKIPGGGLSR